MTRVHGDVKSFGSTGRRKLASSETEVLVIRETETYVARIDSLEEITQWLGTFRERLRQARVGDRADLAQVVEKLEDRYQLRRAELS